MQPVSGWFTVEHDAERVRLRSSAGEGWDASFAWADIERVCFEAADFLMSDSIYVFVRGRAESYVIPSDAQGGAAFWGALVERKLFDAELAIRAATSGPGLFCWPPVEP
ncbi:MAG: hypothetical protein HY908_03630 [Myxococcales bacterium]|nr:hypothetical protein [Myxococcales bacterium]